MSDVPEKTPADKAFERAQWLLTEPGGGRLLDFTLRRDAHSIARNPLERLPPEIANRVSAEVLDLRETSVADLSPLAGLRELQVVRLDGSPITDLSPLANCPNLRELSASRTGVSDLSPLQNLTELRDLTINNTGVRDLSPLRALKHLRYLWALNTPISDLEALRELTTLDSIWLDNTNVADLRPLANLTNLRQLRLNKSKVSDLSPVANLVRLVEATEAPTTRNSVETNGLEFSGAPISFEVVREFASLRNPERTRRTINYYRAIEGLDLVGDWQSDVPGNSAGSDADGATFPEQTNSAVRFSSGADGQVDIAPPAATSLEVGVLRSEVLRKAAELAAKCPDGRNDDTAEVRSASLRIVGLLEADGQTREASAAAIWSYANSLKSKLRADVRRQRLSLEDRERLLEDPPLLIGLSEDLSDLVATIDRFSVADEDLSTIEQVDPSADERAEARRVLESGARSLARSAIDAAGLITGRAADVLRPIADRLPSVDASESKADVVEVGTVENLIIVALDQAILSAAPRVRDESNTSEDATLLRKAAQNRQDSSFGAKMKAGAAGAIGTALVAKGDAALSWLVANFEKVLAVISSNPAFKFVAQVLHALARTFGS